MKVAIKLPTILLSQLLTKDAFAGVEIFSTHFRNNYRVEVAELDGKSDSKELVGSTYENWVCALAVDGTHLWDAFLGGSQWQWLERHRVCREEAGRIYFGMKESKPSMAFESIFPH